MKQTKSIIALFLAAVMALAMLGGCAEGPNGDPTQSPETDCPSLRCTTPLSFPRTLKRITIS